MAAVRLSARMQQVKEVAGGIAVQPHEHVVRRGPNCRLLVREPNLKLPNVPGVNMEVGELTIGLELLNVRETNAEVLILPNVRFLFPLLQGMKEKCLLVTGVPESGHYRQDPAEKGGVVQRASQQVLGMLEVLLVERGQLRHIVGVSKTVTLGEGEIPRVEDIRTVTGRQDGPGCRTAVFKVARGSGETQRCGNLARISGTLKGRTFIVCRQPHGLRWQGVRKVRHCRCSSQGSF
ncbi:Hypothetical predicted protein [Pelobates cultripes]|uniref:Uncharacterized protein n=1 Tax=Pelobates cultripes TaxID=61616 RepID=A0AAD1T5K1_PELCU|nr:Hypothetical predicted protein [Pelobates cultripes]